jgi:cobalt-precorrin-5B (C1)-methyltransferase
MLKSGYTTGACAAAAAKGAAQMLRDQLPVDEVEIILPRGEAVRFPLRGERFTTTSASCYTVKEAGDDPDVTNGVEVHATLTMTSPAVGKPRIAIVGGAGIGRVTKPGLAVPVGSWAINPVPLLMIRHAINEVFAIRTPFDLEVTISIPNGADLAARTLNARLGIVGGLSILGTTGIVRPVSAAAWTDTIDTAIDVALAGEAPAVVLSTGRSSELAAQRLLGQGGGGSGVPLPEEAFVMMGDYVAHAVRSSARKGVERLVICGQFAKLLKIACGHEQTHVAEAELDLHTLASWVRAARGDGRQAEWIDAANTAREVLDRYDDRPGLVALVTDRARRFVRELAPAVAVQVLLVGYDKEPLYFG